VLVAILLALAGATTPVQAQAADDSYYDSATGLTGPALRAALHERHKASTS